MTACVVLWDRVSASPGFKLAWPEVIQMKPSCGKGKALVSEAAGGIRLLESPIWN